LASIAIVAAAGCYRYEIIPIAQLQPGMEVRTRLSGDAVDRARRSTETPAGMLDGFIVRGQVARVGHDSLQLTIPTTVSDGGYRTSVLTQDVSLPQSDVVGVEVRQMDKTKTALMTAAAGIAAFFIVRQAQGGGNAVGKPPGGGGPPENRIPVDFRLLLR
jgi:hypothetical protein